MRFTKEELESFVERGLTFRQVREEAQVSYGVLRRAFDQHGLEWPWAKRREFTREELEDVAASGLTLMQACRQLRTSDDTLRKEFDRHGLEWPWTRRRLAREELEEVAVSCTTIALACVFFMVKSRFLSVLELLLAPQKVK